MRSENSRKSGVNANLLRAVVAQFVARDMHPAADIAQFERLALGLIDALEGDSVAPLARDLCRHPETPTAIVARFFDKGGACACAAFSFAPNVPRADLLAMAEYGPRDFAEAIAGRADLDRDLIALLASRGEAGVLRALARNRLTRFDHAARRALTTAARDDLELGRLLLDRGDVDLDPETLFLASTAEERMAVVVDACRAALASNAPDVAPKASTGLVLLIESLAVARDRDGMAAALADALDCRKDRARAIVLDEGGEPLALVFVVLGVAVEAATRVFLCAGPSIAHDHPRLRALRALMRSTPPRAAAHIVAAIVGAQRHERDATRRVSSRDEQGYLAQRRAPRTADFGSAGAEAVSAIRPRR